MLFVLPLSDHAGHFLKDFISTKSSLPWNEMASQHHGVVIEAYGSLHERKPGIHRSITNMGVPPPSSSEGLPYDEEFYYTS